MPTGYTQPLKDGQEMTFAQFALRCSRAMGAAIEQRDESLEVEIRLMTVADRYRDRLAEARVALEAAQMRTAEEWLSLQDAEISKAEAWRAAHLQDVATTRDRYLSMLQAVRDWRPPTTEHEGLKKFMTDQLTESLKFDCGWPSGDRWAPEVPPRVSAEEYEARVIARLTSDLNFASDALAKEFERVRSQNEWVTALRDSLEVSA